jgi:hypothetical protein
MAMDESYRYGDTNHEEDVASAGVRVADHKHRWLLLLWELVSSASRGNCRMSAAGSGV